jgi:hypothetical protein
MDRKIHEKIINFFENIFWIFLTGLDSEKCNSSPLFMQNSGGVGEDEGEEADLVVVASLS